VPNFAAPSKTLKSPAAFHDDAGLQPRDVTPGVDEMANSPAARSLAAIVPFNFPRDGFLLVLPYAIACGNTFILKPSERVPLSMHRAFELWRRPASQRSLNLVNGGKEVVMRSATIRKCARSVLSAPLRRQARLYSLGPSGKRMQCQGRRQKIT